MIEPVNNNTSAPSLNGTQINGYHETGYTELNPNSPSPIARTTSAQFNTNIRGKSIS